MKVAAVVILYNPEIDFVRHNILQYIDAVGKVLLWKNSCFEMDFPEQYQQKIVWMGTGANEFVAKPLNEVLCWCKEQGYDYLLTMDQDSTWIDFSGFLQKVQQYEKADIAIYSPNVNNQFPLSAECYEVESVITSGALVKVDTALALEGFREDYKIYWVDGEYCYYARSRGFRIVCLPHYNLKQRFGEPVKNIFNIYVANYSPTVYYFMFRNMFWMHREFGDKAVSWRTIGYTGFLFLRSILLVEASKIKKLSKVLKGILEGCFGKLNKRRQ